MAQSQREQTAMPTDSKKAIVPEDDPQQDLQGVEQPTVFIVDDEPDVCAALAMLIRSIGLDVKTFESAQAFWDQFDPEVPGCLILDVRMAGMTGIELQEKLNGLDYHVPIIMMSGHGDVPMAVRIIQSGAIDFIQKPFSDLLLLDRIQHALQMDAQRREERRDRMSIKNRYDALEPIEREIMLGVVAGSSNRVIAKDLGLDVKAVETHQRAIVKKMGADSLSDLVRMAAALESCSLDL
jgi:two-component system, LuxR family, response regulator FixJ